MASLFTTKAGCRIVQISRPGERRQCVRLGKVSLRAAEEFKRRMERLQEHDELGQPLSPELAQWVAGLPAKMAKRLAAV